MYLVTSTNGVQDYTEINKDEEEKLGGLYRNRALPPEFMLHGKRIVYETILGFSDNPPPRATSVHVKNFDELKDWVQKQRWYLKTHPVEKVSPVVNQGELIPTP